MCLNCILHISIHNTKKLRGVHTGKQGTIWHSSEEHFAHIAIWFWSLNQKGMEMHWIKCNRLRRIFAIVHYLDCGYPWLMAPLCWWRNLLLQFSGTALFCELCQNTATEKLWHFFCWAAGGEEGPLRFAYGDLLDLHTPQKYIIMRASK